MSPHRPRRCHGVRLLVFMALLILCMADTSIADDEDHEDIIDLDALSIEELEAVCTDRGFELVKGIDEVTGNEILYTHEQYKDAARQCLEIEEEMNQVLADNPEMLEQVREEQERMEAAKALMEKELAEAQSKGSESSSSPETPPVETDTTSSVGTVAEEETPPVATDTATSSGDTVAEEKTPPVEMTDAASTSINNVVEEQTEKESDTIDSPPTSEQATTNPTLEEDTTTAADEPVISENTTDSTMEEKGSEESFEETRGEPKPENELSSGGDEIIQEEEVDISKLGYKEVFALQFKELWSYIKRDLNMVADILLPKPLRAPLKAAIVRAIHVGKEVGMSTFDLVKRYLVAMFASASKIDNNSGIEENQQAPAEGVPAATESS